MKEAKTVLGKMAAPGNWEVVDYKQYMYYLSERMKNVTDVMKKYNVAEQMQTLLGENNYKEIHYPLANEREEIDFQIKFGDALKVDFKNPEAVFERLCMHLRDVSQTIDSFEHDLKEDIREANDNIKEEYRKWKANVDNYDDPTDLRANTELAKHGLAFKPEVVQYLKANHEIDLDNMHQYEEAIDNEERFIKKAKSMVETVLDHSKENNVELSYNEILRDKVVIKEHISSKQIDNLYAEKQEEIENQKQEAKRQKEEAAAAEEAELYYPEENEIRLISKSLEEAKTITNSSQYNDLRKIFKALADPKTSATLSDDAKKALYVKAGTTINEYITHKAKDGVKPNVFKKLAAVEAASKCIERRLQSLDVKGINLSLDKQEKRLDGPLKEVYDQFQTDKNAGPDKNKTCKEVIASVQNKNLKKVMTLSHICMNKIIATSLEQKVGKVYDLNKSRVQFANEEFVKKELAPKEAEAAPMKL